MKRFKNILYVSEQSVDQGAALARAASLARNNQARLTVLDVVPEIESPPRVLPPDCSAADLGRAVVARRRQMLEATVAAHASGLGASIEVLAGREYLEVIRAVLRDSHDLVIKPAEDPAPIERLFGSDDMHLLRKCPCPVWLMKPGEQVNYESILAAVDFSPNRPNPDEDALNREIVELAASLALSDFAQLHLVHAWDAPEAGFIGLWTDNPRRAETEFTEGVRAWHSAALDNLAQGLRAHIGADTYGYLAPQMHLPMGPPRKAIPTLARQLRADLVVMGTVARTGIPGLFIGNTAESVLDQLTCSVLAIKPPGFATPVSV